MTLTPEQPRRADRRNLLSVAVMGLLFLPGMLLLYTPNGMWGFMLGAVLCCCALWPVVWALLTSRTQDSLVGGVFGAILIMLTMGCGIWQAYEGRRQMDTACITVMPGEYEVISDQPGRSLGPLRLCVP